MLEHGNKAKGKVFLTLGIEKEKSFIERKIFQI
jgi:hypothetical protein